MVLGIVLPSAFYSRYASLGYLRGIVVALLSMAELRNLALLGAW